jgi:hypothetical protein
MRSEKNLLSSKGFIWPSLFPAPLSDEHAESDEHSEGGQPPGFHCRIKGK